MTSKTIKTKRPVTRKSAMFFLTLALIITFSTTLVLIECL